MGQIVIDCSVILGWLLKDSVIKDEDELLVKNVVQLRFDVLAPRLLQLEVLNACYWRHHLLMKEIRVLLNRLEDLEINYLDTFFDVAELAMLMDKYHLTAYDSGYLQLAMNQDCQLITHDKVLLRADKKRCITPEQWLAEMSFT